MIKIYLCEDNDAQRENFSRQIKDFLAKNIVDVVFELSTNDPNILLDNVKQNKSTGLYFLDIDLKANMTGIELAKKIREFDTRGFIVFITTHSEMAFLTFSYKVEALDFIIKDNYDHIKLKIDSCINEALKRNILSDSHDQVFKIQTGESIAILKFDEILLFETTESKHKIRVHTYDRQIEFYSELKKVEEDLNTNFIRCHKSYIINKNKIKNIDKKNKIIYLDNNESCFCSRAALKDLSNSISNIESL